MGRKSTRENKNIYMRIREELQLTREKASELMPGMEASRLEKIESEKVKVRPDDIKMMAECYKRPELYNYYCSNVCDFCEKVPEVKHKELAQIAVETVNSLNRLDREKDRLLEIVEDGEITEDEYEDFVRIKALLDKIETSVDNLQLWIDKKIAAGAIEKGKIK